MPQTPIQTQLEPHDLQHLNRWVASGKFVDLADAIQSAIHAGVNWWLFEEFAKWEKEKYGGMTEVEFNKAIAEEGMAPLAKPQSDPQAASVVEVIADSPEYEDTFGDYDASDWDAAMWGALRTRLRYLVQHRGWSCGEIAERLKWEGLAASEANVESWYRGQKLSSNPDALLDALNRMLEA